VEAEFCHADGRKDGRTDRYDKANGRFSPFFRKRLTNIHLLTKMYLSVSYDFQYKLIISLNHINRLNPIQYSLALPYRLSSSECS